MIVLIDALGITNETTGVSQYSMQLLKKLVKLDAAINYIILINPKLEEHHEVFQLANSCNNISLFPMNIPAIGLVRDIKYLFLKKKFKFDVFHCLNSNLPLVSMKNAIVTIHDLKYVLFPHYLGKFNWLKSKYLAYLFYNVIRKACRIIAVSESTKNDLIEIYADDFTKQRKPENIVKVVYEASSIEKIEYNQILDTYSLHNKYFLYIGELRPHKNLENLIGGFEYLLDNYEIKEEVNLVIVGKKHKSFSDKSHKHGQLRFLGYLEDKYLYTLYKNALAYCLVSRYEGFGLPILEAMDSDTPVITSNISSMKEVAGDAALLIEPENPLSIAEAMYKVYSDPDLRNSLIMKGHARVKDFSWQKTAEETLELYKKVLHGN